MTYLQVQVDGFDSSNRRFFFDDRADYYSEFGICGTAFLANRTPRVTINDA